MTALQPCQSCGNPCALDATACPKCGKPNPTITAQKKQASSQAGAIAVLLLMIAGGLYWYSSIKESWKKSSKQEDAKFCAENLSYYEGFCRTWPDKCTEGPRKLARCDP